MNDNALAPMAALAGRLRCCERTARRRLDDAMRADPTLRVIRRGRTILFTEEQLQRVVRALEWRSPFANVGKSGTRAARSASGAKPSPSQNSAQERVRALTQKLTRQPKKPASGRNILKAIPGGRDG